MIPQQREFNDVLLFSNWEITGLLQETVIYINNVVVHYIIPI